MDGGVAALGAADGPRAARLAGRGRQRVVAAFAVRAADGMDRRQVDDVEAHGGRAVELRLRVLERAVPALAAAAAWEELVPGGEARALAVRDHLELPAGPRGRAAVEIRIHEMRQPHVARDLDGVGLRGRLFDPPGVG